MSGIALATTDVVHCSLAVAHQDESIRSEEEESILGMGKRLQEDTQNHLDCIVELRTLVICRDSDLEESSHSDRCNVLQ